MTSHCASCGTEIPPGTGHYDTPAGLFCLDCGLPFPLTRDVKVQITILDPEHRLDRYTIKDRR